MIIIVAALLGAVIGGLKAKKRKGTAADIAQYGVAFAIAFSLVALLLTIAIQRIAA